MAPEESTGGPPDEHTQELAVEPVRGPWLVEIGTPEGASSRTLSPGERWVLGSAKIADWRVHDPAVSGVHCALESSLEGIRVEDLGSKNGILLGVARVRSAALTTCGSSFVIGHTTVTVRPVSGEDAITNRDCRIPGLVGSSGAMRRVAEAVRRYAPLRAPMLIVGESGTGKDLVARAVHQLSGRSGAYLPLNVGAISETLADAELFGHRRGAFTGAVASRAGAFEQAHRGTLFLDEIADLPPTIQVKLLRVVEDGSVRPLGAPGVLQVDVRVVAATWAELRNRVEEGRFREDLWHRLSTVIIELPPLRHRKSDLPALSRALLGRFATETGAKELSAAALARLVAHHWPGNVRELGSVLYRAAVTSPDRFIQPEHLEIHVPRAAHKPAPSLSPSEALVLLRKHAGNVSAAARTARVARSTFRSWLDKSRQPLRTGRLP
jgi:DNA-binding NtrC family response regulator